MVDRPLTVLVTGATGFAGSHTTRALLDAGHRVRAFVRSHEKAHRVLGELERLELARGDIGDAASVREALRAEIAGTVRSPAELGSKMQEILGT